MPAGFVWSQIDINDDTQADEACIFLNANYIEDDEGKVVMYHFRESLRYQMQVPGYISDLHFCVRNESNNKIMAAIFACPKRL